MTEEEEGDRAREGHSHSKKRSAETGDHRVRKKAKSGSKEKLEVDGKHQRSSAKNSQSGSGRKPLQESKITSSKKFKSDAVTSGSEAEAIKLDSYEDLEKRADGNNNLEKIMRPQGTEKEECELDFLPVEAKNCKLSNNGNKSSHSHKDHHKTTDDKDLKPRRSRSEKDWKKDSNGSTDVNCNKIHAKVKQTDNSHTSPTALKEEDVEVQIFDPISGCTQACVPDENDLEVRKEKSKAEKKRDKECTVNTTKDKTQGQKKKRSSHSTGHNEPKKNKKPKREENKGKKDQKEKDAKKAEDEAGKWKW